MRIIEKNNQAIISNEINAKDVYYCKFNGVYTAFKFKSAKVEFRATKGPKYHIVNIELPILTAVDNKEHKKELCKINTKYMGYPSASMYYDNFTFYRTKDDVKNNKPFTLRGGQICQDVCKNGKEIGLFNCWKWDGVKCVNISWFEEIPCELQGFNFITYDLLTDIFYTELDEIPCFYLISEKDECVVYLLRSDCEIENKVTIFEFGDCD